MANLITRCSSCRSSNVKVAKIQCADCDTRFEGAFEIPDLLKIEDGGLQFIVDFVKSSGSLKEMASLYEVSYPTLRNKLNAIIHQLEDLSGDKVDLKDSILKKLEAGKITAKQAAKLLKET